MACRDMSGDMDVLVPLVFLVYLVDVGSMGARVHRSGLILFRSQMTHSALFFVHPTLKKRQLSSGLSPTSSSGRSPCLRVGVADVASRFLVLYPSTTASDKGTV